MLTEQYSSLSPALIKRFKEREDNVKADIFEAYITLLKQTKAFSIMRGGDVILDTSDMETDGPIVLLQQQVSVNTNKYKYSGYSSILFVFKTIGYKNIFLYSNDVLITGIQHYTISLKR